MRYLLAALVVLCAFVVGAVVAITVLSFIGAILFGIFRALFG